MRKQLQDFLFKRAQQCVSNIRDSLICEKMEKKKELFNGRSAEIIKVKARGAIDKVKKTGSDIELVYYRAHMQYLINQKDCLYLEEEVEMREAEFYKGILIHDLEKSPYYITGAPEGANLTDMAERKGKGGVFRYNRLKAVQYAERWWNDYNPAYKKFDVDCTNYISQCLHAGGAPMSGYPNRSRGWWMRSNNWSYSWSVANALRWYLPSSKSGLRAKEVKNPEQLLLGDIICYDFEGDGRFNHNTMVTAKDANGMPLVNAHTFNCRMRYWSYEDSTAYTPNIQYKFLSITDDE
nr:amidase domain-containing protein [uncultured Bacillus sp.]